MSDTNNTPVTHAEEECASWIDEMGDSAAVIKKIKRNNNFHRQSPEPGSSNPIELPQGIFREVPVHVTRTPNRSVQALPPPSAQPQVLPTRRKNEGRRRPKRLGGNGDGDDSGSDSGGDGRRNGRHSPDGPLQKRKAPPPEVEPPSRDATSRKSLLANQKPIVLSPEEEERVWNLRRLHEFENSLGTRLELRELNKAERKRQIETLLEGKRHSAVPSVAWNQIEEQQMAVDKYLDVSLYFAIANDRLRSQIDLPEKQTIIADMIAETESRVIEILKSALTRLGFRVSIRVPRPGITLSFERALDSKYPLPEFQFPYRVFGKDFSVEKHVRIPPIPMLEHRNGSPREIYSHPLVSAYLRILMGGTLDGCIGGLPVSDILTYSKSYDLMGTGYIESLRSLVGEPVFDSFVAPSQDLISRARLIVEYREEMKALNMRVSQEFFQSGSDVNLVLFKGGRPSTIKGVHPDDLESMGWRLDGEFGRDQQGAERYWRYATARHQTSLSHPVIDMVVDMVTDMDGNVLDAWKRQTLEVSV